MGKFYFNFDKTLNKIREILEQILKRLEFVNSFMKHNIKLRWKKLGTDNSFFEKSNLSAKNKKTLQKRTRKFLSKPE